MNVLNPLQEFVRLTDIFGPLCGLAIIFTVGYTIFAEYRKAVLWGMLVLLSTQVWYFPVYGVTRAYRWWVVGILVIRGLFALQTAAPRIRSTSMARGLIFGLAAMSMASAWWAKDFQAAAFLAGSLAVGIVLVYLVFWRLQDQADLVGKFPKGAVVISFLVYGLGLLLAMIGLTTGSYDLLAATGIGGRYSGVFMNPNMAGLLGAVLLPIVIAAPRAFLGGVAWMRAPAIVFLIVSIFMSGSRSAIIGSALAGALLLIYRSKLGSFFAISAGAALVWAIFTYAPLEHVDDTMFGHITRTKHIHTLSGRLELWEMGWNAAQESPVVGLGWGASRSLGMEFDMDAIMKGGGLNFASNLHSAHVQLLVDLGVVGLAVFWLFSLCVLWAGVRVFRAPKSPHNELVVIIFASWTGMFADTFVHGGVFSIGSPSALIFWTFASIVLKQADLVEAIAAFPESARRAPPPPPLVAAAG